MTVIPARRFWQTHNETENEKTQCNLEGDREPPANRGGFQERKAEIDPVTGCCQYKVKWITARCMTNLSITPKTIKEPSIITICPLRCDLEVSDCQVGTVEVFCSTVSRPAQARLTTRPPTDHAIAEASNQSCRDQLADAERRSLQSSTDYHYRAANKYRFPSP